MEARHALCCKGKEESNSVWGPNCEDGDRKDERDIPHIIKIMLEDI
jgi:hypothetical protein